MEQPAAGSYKLTDNWLQGDNSKVRGNQGCCFVLERNKGQDDGLEAAKHGKMAEVGHPSDEAPTLWHGLHAFQPGSSISCRTLGKPPNPPSPSLLYRRDRLHELMHK